MEHETYIYSTDDYVIFRLISAISSAICAPLVYIIMICLDSSCLSSFTTAFLVCCETSCVSASRNASSKGLVQLFVTFSIFLITSSQFLRKNSLLWIICIFFQALSTGASISSDIYCISLLLFTLLFYFVNGEWIYPVFVNIFMSLFMFYVTFYAHFYTSINGIDFNITHYNISNQISKCILRSTRCRYISSTFETIFSTMKIAIGNKNKKVPIKKSISTLGSPNQIIIMMSIPNGILIIVGIVFSVLKIVFEKKPFSKLACIQYGFDFSFLVCIIIGGDDPSALMIPFLFGIIISIRVYEIIFPKYVSTILFILCCVFSLIFLFVHHSQVFGFGLF